MNKRGVKVGCIGERDHLSAELSMPWGENGAGKKRSRWGYSKQNFVQLKEQERFIMPIDQLKPRWEGEADVLSSYRCFHCRPAWRCMLPHQQGSRSWEIIYPEVWVNMLARQIALSVALPQYLEIVSTASWWIHEVQLLAVLCCMTPLPSIASMGQHSCRAGARSTCGLALSKGWLKLMAFLKAKHVCRSLVD